MDLANLIIQLFIVPERALQLDEAQWVPVIRILRHQQLLARYAERLRVNQLFEQLPDYAKHHMLNTEVLANKQCHQVLFEADELVRLLAPLNVEPVFLKGAAYSLGYRLSVGKGRTYSDIDILVPKEAITAVEQRLSLHGYFSEPMSDYDQRYYRRWTHEIPPVRHHSRGTVLDIHHNLVPPVSGRAPEMHFFDSHLQVSAEGHKMLSLAGLTLHSLIHLLFNEDFKNAFRDLTDLHLLFSQCTEQDWQQLVQLAQQTGFEFELFLASRYCETLLHSPIPKSFRQQLDKVRPNKLRMRLLDAMFLRVLCPRHPVIDRWPHKMADWLVWLRGHWLKMPLPILIWHLLAKSSKGLLVALLGKSYFEPERR